MKTIDLKTYENEVRRRLNDCCWDETSGMSPAAMRAVLRKETDGLPVNLARAKIFAFVLDNAQLYIDGQDWFQDRINHGGILGEHRAMAVERAERGALRQAHECSERAFEAGAYRGGFDFCHVSPDWERLFRLGFKGIYEELRREREKKQTGGTLGAEQEAYYRAGETVYSAVLRLLKRQAAAAEKIGGERMRIVAEGLKNLSEGAPSSLLEAMQITFTAYYLMMVIEGSNVRSLGALDSLYMPFYNADLESGRFSQSRLCELVDCFFCRWSAMDVVSNIPFYLGGWDSREKADRIGKFSYFLVNRYRNLNLCSPKMQIRCNRFTPRALIEYVLDCIRSGSSSFVFMNDDAVIPALTALGESERDASDYTPVGCYEPLASGKEIACTCSGEVNLAKAVEFVMGGGEEYLHGIRLYGPAPSAFSDFDSLFEEVKKRATDFVSAAMNIVAAYDREYPNVFSSPLLSATFRNSVERGQDVYHGGAKYNNSGINIIGLGTAVDALAAVRELVYEEKLLTLEELNAVLKDNWQGNELLRRRALHCREKYGNGSPVADGLMLELCSCLCKCFENRKNGRGGVFRMGLFSVDNCIVYGAATGASADGRKAGEPISKNLCASVAQDRNGVTALMNSITCMDLKKAPNGAVLDVTLHPTAVSGGDGLAAFYGLLTAYFALGGQSIQFNVFNAEDLRRAQKEPEKYASLQVRLCGWNVRFVSLSKIEQDLFIRDAEKAEVNG